MLKDLTYMNEDREEGFSLVELLVVIVIIGILSSIAIAAFLNQRQKANDASVKADVNTVRTVVETALIDAPNATGFSGESTSDGTLTVSLTSSGGTTQSEEVNLSNGVSIDVSGSDGTYTIEGTHENGKATSVSYDSATGKTTVNE